MEGLVLYERARLLLAECASVDDVQQIKARAIAIQEYARRAKDRTLLAKSITIRLRAERRLGELLKTQSRSPGRKPSMEELARNRAIRDQLTEGVSTEDLAKDHGLSQRQVQRIAHGEDVAAPPPTLRELGISSRSSRKAKQIASMHEDDFETSVAELETSIAEGRARPTSDLLAVKRKRTVERPRSSPAIIYASPLSRLRNLEGDWHIFVWCTPKQLQDALYLLKRHGAKYATTFACNNKDPVATRVKLIIHGRLGSPRFATVKDFRTAFSDSTGPKTFRQTIERVTGRKVLSA